MLLRLAARDTLLLATDGLLDNLRMGEIVELIRKGTPGTAAHAMAALCGARMQAAEQDAPRKPDDATFILHRAVREAAPRARVRGGGGS